VIRVRSISYLLGLELFILKNGNGNPADVESAKGAGLDWAKKSTGGAGPVLKFKLLKRVGLRQKVNGPGRIILSDMLVWCASICPECCFCNIICGVCRWIFPKLLSVVHLRTKMN